MEHRGHFGGFFRPLLPIETKVGDFVTLHTQAPRSKAAILTLIDGEFPQPNDGPKKKRQQPKKIAAVLQALVSD